MRSSSTPLGTRVFAPGTSSARAPSGRGASSSTATGAGCSRGTCSSSRSRALGFCGTASARRPSRPAARGAFSIVRVMPTYQRRGDVPRKRHIQFRDNGTLLTEEVMGLEGFTGNESILYHLTSPCRVKKLGAFEQIERKEWVPDEHRPLHLKTWEVDAGGDALGGRQLLMWNDDVEISLCRPDAEMDYFF